MKEMISTIKTAWKESPGKVITDVVFLLGLFAFTYLAFWIHANIIY